LFYEKPCPSPYSPRWQVVVRRENHGEAIVSAWGDSAEDATKRAHVAAAADALYAYAKAESLLEQLADADTDNVTALRQAYREHVRSMGWNGEGHIDAFLRTYRAAALAQAEGRNP
jgi:hypothetical protein